MVAPAVAVEIVRSNGVSKKPRFWLNLVSATKSPNPPVFAAPGEAGLKKRRWPLRMPYEMSVFCGG